MKKAKDADTPTYWQQVSQITINDGALFLTGITDDPTAHEQLMCDSEVAYDHFAATRMDQASENIALILDAIESKDIAITRLIKRKNGEIDAVSKISKSDFIKWCGLNGRFDVIRLLTTEPDQNKSSSSSTGTKHDPRARAIGALTRHKKLISDGIHNPTQVLAKEMGVTVCRVGQLLRKAKKHLEENPTDSTVYQLKSIARNKK